MSKLQSTISLVKDELIVIYRFTDFHFVEIHEWARNHLMGMCGSSDT